MNIILKKIGMLSIALGLFLPARATWVGTIATANRLPITVSAAVAGTALASLYAINISIDESHLILKLSSSWAGRLLLRMVGASDRPERAVYAYRVLMVLCGGAMATGLGYTIAHYFSSGRATNLAQLLSAGVVASPLAHGSTHKSINQIIEQAPNSTHFPLHDAVSEINNLCQDAGRANTMCANVIKNKSAGPEEKTICQSIISELESPKKVLTAAHKQVVCDQRFMEEELVIIERERAQAEQDRAWAQMSQAGEMRERNRIEDAKFRAMNNRKNPHVHISISNLPR